MKFNLNDFLQLDTNGLLAVNGGSDCSSGSPSGSSDSSSGSSIASGGTGGNSGSSGGSSNAVPIKYGSRGKGWWGPVAWSDGSYLDGNGNRVYPSSTKTRTASGGASSGGGGCGNAGSSVGGTSPNSAPKYPSGQGGSSDPSGGNNGGGTCSAGTQTPPVENPNTEKTSGKFAQITDGSYADNLTMQFYKKLGTVKGMEYDLAMNDGKDQNGNVIDFLFSSTGCLMAGTAKIASEATGQNISLLDINEKCDINKDGLLDYEEISKGLQDILGQDFEVKTDYWQDYLSKEKFEDCAEKGDYVLARARIDDVNRNNIQDDYHWVVLEGYTTDAQGRLCFTYDGTSDNDAGRKYVYGAEDLEKREFSIDKIITVHINKR